MINGKRYMINSEGEHKLICEESESHLTPQDDEHVVRSESESEDSSAEPDGVSTLGWRDVIVTMDTKALTVYYSEPHGLHDSDIEITKD